MKDDRRRTKDEGRGTKDEGRRMTNGGGRPLHRWRAGLLVGVVASAAGVPAAQSPIQACHATPAPAWCSAVPGDRSEGWAPQRRSEVMARNGIVATSQPLAAEAGPGLPTEGRNGL